MCGNASGRGSPAPAMPDVGARLVEFSIENPDPVWVSNLYKRLGPINPPEVRKAANFAIARKSKCRAARGNFGDNRLKGDAHSWSSLVEMPN